MAEPVRFATEAGRVVDQFVVDGKLDLLVVNGNPERPSVHISSLGAVALDVIWGKTPYDVRQDFGHALDVDARHLGHDNDGRYQFEPVLSPGASVEPRLKAYICGTAHATPEQYATAAVRVQQLFDVLCADSDGVLTQLSIRRVLIGHKITSLSEIAAMREYVLRGADGRVVPLPDGRFVIKSLFKGNIDKIEPEPQVENLVEAVLGVLQSLNVGRSMLTNRTAILAALAQAQGHLLAQNQHAEFNRILDSLPGILRPIGYGRYALDKRFLDRAIAIVGGKGRPTTRTMPGR